MINTKLGWRARTKKSKGLHAKREGVLILWFKHISLLSKTSLLTACLGEHYKNKRHLINQPAADMHQ